MLNTSDPHASFREKKVEHDGSQVVDFEKFILIARRQWFLMVVILVLSMSLGVVYIKTATPLYRATAGLIVDRSGNDMAGKMGMVDASSDDEGFILNQLEIFRSKAVATAVINKLDLSNNETFLNSHVGISSIVAGYISEIRNNVLGREEVLNDQQRRLKALDILDEGMAIDRNGRSDAISINFTSPSAELAATIASEIAEQYIVDRLDSKLATARETSEWLKQRNEELKRQAEASDLAVQKFRSNNGLLSTGGQLVSEQRLSQLNAELTVAQADTARAKAKYDKMESIIESSQPDAVLSESLDSPVSNYIRQKYFDAFKLQAEISARSGDTHQRAVELRSEMNGYKQQLFEEVKRTALSYKNDYDAALSRQQTITQSLAEASGTSSEAGETSVQLRELERSAATYSGLYQAFLQHYQETLQQQSFPVSDARVITRPDVPEKPSLPKKPMALAFFACFGLALGAGIAGLREFRDSCFRTGDQIRRDLGLDLLGSVPNLKLPLKLPAEKVIHGDREASARVTDIRSYTVQNPLSPFAETMRNAKIAVDAKRKGSRGVIVGVASTMPSEGKSTVSINFATLLAMQGARTLLIDCDLRNPGATRMVGGTIHAGLVETIKDPQTLLENIIIDERTKLAFLPALSRSADEVSSAGYLASRGMQELLQAAKATFDYVILDVPPLGAVVDAKIILPSADSTIMVVEWGKTMRRLVRSVVASSPEIFTECAGVILNKIDPKKLRLYRSYESTDYFNTEYSSYYKFS